MIAVTTAAPKTHQQVEEKSNCCYDFEQLVMAETSDHAVVEEQQEDQGEEQTLMMGIVPEVMCLSLAGMNSKLIIICMLPMNILTPWQPSDFINYTPHFS